MFTRRLLFLSAGLSVVASRFGCDDGEAVAAQFFPVSHSDAEWRKILTADQYSVLRQEGTEYPFTSPLLNEHRKGNFACAGCDQNAFSSTTKFESGTGWPSFWAPLKGRYRLARTVQGALCVPRFTAAVVAAISATSSTTVQSRPGCDTA